MMEKDTPMSEQESLQLITQMIQTARSSFHDSGTSAILWGSVVGFCGLLGFAQRMWDFSIGFDVWLLTLVALIPQLWITMRNKRQKVVKKHDDEMTDAIWLTYGISVFALMFYWNVIPYSSQHLLEMDQVQLLRKDLATGVIENWRPSVFSAFSLLLILFSIPTLATGVGKRFRPMIIGAVICYILFIVSCFVSGTWDQLLGGLAGIFNWFIPGLILRRKYHRAQQHV